MNFNEIIMQRCIDIAKLGLGDTAPNPIVGCVITCNNEIIGEGYHKKFGEPHAEVNAINSLKNKEQLKNSVLFVTLEPCSHFGKTPPCADLIIKNNIKQVKVSSLDPNPIVAGNGINKLINAGVNVETGILEDVYKWENRRFFTFHLKKRPYIILKWAKTIDGFIDIERNNNVQNVNWITNHTCKIMVHKWRAEEQAILVGYNTVLKDNPELTTREFVGKSPLRIVIDRNLTLNIQNKIFNTKAKTIIISEKTKEIKLENVEIINVNFNSNFEENLLSELYKLNIQSLIIEGGLYTLNSFINKNLWDEARVFTGNKNFIKGVTTPILINEKLISTDLIGDCKLEVYKNKFI